MDILKRYAIPYKGLSIGNHHFEFEVDDRFFDAFEGSEIHRGHASVSVELVKTERLLTLDFTIDGGGDLRPLPGRIHDARTLCRNAAGPVFGD